MRRGFTRRELLKHAGAGAIMLGLGLSAAGKMQRTAWALTEEERHALLMKGTVDFKGFVAKEITPNDDFYITTYSSEVPDTKVDSFRLSVEGKVDKPFSLTMKQIEDMRDRTEFVTMQCIGNPIGGSAISNALWDGVTLRKVIERAAPGKGIVKTVFHADDGYSDSIPYSLSVSDDVFMAFRMNDKPLPGVHGFPLRMIVPGIYGMKSVKWVSKIELVDYDYKGYWEKRGWSDEAVIPVRSQILMPMDGKSIRKGSYVIGGIALGGRFGISRVQVSLDDGRTWHEAETKKPLSRWAWTLWRYDWKAEETGDYTIKVRAFDRQGKVQETPSFLGRILGTYPDGAKGLHSVRVTVVR